VDEVNAKLAEFIMNYPKKGIKVSCVTKINQNKKLLKMQEESLKIQQQLLKIQQKKIQEQKSFISFTGFKNTFHNFTGFKNTFHNFTNLKNVIHNRPIQFFCGNCR